MHRRAAYWFRNARLRARRPCPILCGIDGLPKVLAACHAPETDKAAMALHFHAAGYWTWIALGTTPRLRIAQGLEASRDAFTEKPRQTATSGQKLVAEEWHTFRGFNDASDVHGAAARVDHSGDVCAIEAA